LPDVQAFAAADLPGVLAQSVSATPAGQGFTQPVAEVGGVVVGLVRTVTLPSFDDARAQLAEQAATDAEKAGAALVSAVRDDLRPKVNPRYGVLDQERVVAGDGGVVRLLADAGATGADGAAAGAAGD
jgi:peptidyl-prolyl cis-trans isomerase SurA